MHIYKIDGIEYTFPLKYKKDTNRCDDKNHYDKLDQDESIHIQMIYNDVDITDERTDYGFIIYKTRISKKEIPPLSCY